MTPISINTNVKTSKWWGFCENFLQHRPLDVAHSSLEILSLWNCLYTQPREKLNKFEKCGSSDGVKSMRLWFGHPVISHKLAINTWAFGCPKRIGEFILSNQIEVFIESALSTRSNIDILTTGVDDNYFLSKTSFWLMWVRKICLNFRAKVIILNCVPKRTWSISKQINSSTSQLLLKVLKNF